MKRINPNIILNKLFHNWIKDYIKGMPKDPLTVIKISDFVFRPYYDDLPTICPSAGLDVKTDTNKSGE